MASLGEAKEKARKAQNEGQYDKAIKIYMQILAALKSNPDPSFYNIIGDIYLNNLKKNAEAVENYRAALTIYVNQSWHSNAIVMAKKIIKVDPTLIEMYETIAELYKKMGSLGEALNSYILLAEKALQSNNKSLAIEAFKKTLELMPDKVEIKDKLVELYMQENNFEFAMEYLREIESYHLKRGDLPQATATRKKISQLDLKMGRPAREERKPEVIEEVKVEPPRPIPEESMDIDINDLTEGLSRQLDETFSMSQAQESHPETEQKIKSTSDNFQSSPSSNELDGLFKEDASSFGSFVELGKLQEDIDIGGAVQSYYQGADGYFETNDMQNALTVYKRIFEIKPDEDKAVKRIIEIANKIQMYNEAVLPYVHLAKQAMDKSPSDALNYANSALRIDPSCQPALQIKTALDVKRKPQSPFEEHKPVQQPASQQQVSQTQQQSAPQQQRSVQQPTPQPKIEEPAEQHLGADRFFNQQMPAEESNPMDDLAKELLEDMTNLDFLKESEHVTAKDIIKGKNEGNKPKFKIEESAPQQDQGVWSLQELLDELKEGLDQNIEESDVSSHYDLGLSFKEMGLYDMAIEEFQKSVKHKDYEVKSLEMLGVCFLEKQEYDLAESSLLRALSDKGRKEIEYLGIKYTLGKLYEAKKMTKEALKLFNEIFTFDAKFEDVEKRINALKSTPKEIEKQASQQKTEKQNDFIDFSAILKDEITSDMNLDDFDVDNFTVELTDEEKENIAKKNNKVSYM
jgi:tetratricopeptide (TPR) repeat protein